jgi:hypothetical protein
LKILDFEWNDFRCGNVETMLNNDNVGTILDVEKIFTISSKKSSKVKHYFVDVECNMFFPV